MAAQTQRELLGLDIEELTAIARGYGQAPYRGRQLFEGLYRQRVQSLDQMSTLARELRVRLEETFVVGVPSVVQSFVSADGTIRYLLALGDGEMVETVWMPEGDGGERGDTEQSPVVSRQSAETNFARATICVSSQVGCALDCQFCMTGLLGVKRNLSVGEIVGQVIAVLRDHDVEVGSERVNLVFMGMGEPFLNYPNLMKAVRLLVTGVGIAEPRMTVSTAGVVPRIYDFGREPVRPKLAISLNASSDELRTRLMPINRKWNLKTLLQAARDFPLRPRERLTFEYVLLDGVNDASQDARKLAGRLRGLRAKVNLIALNPGPEVPFRTPPNQQVQRFRQILVDAGIPAFVRQPRGRDIYAACGQLKKTVAIGPSDGPAAPQP